ncbi:hypothetical protein TCE0_018f05966 [Talaromyces pinophilus]|uniref:Peptidase S8/S53 domain-containing protein n=1 Tax=Talaromyces pinophilus TaxID=128442 RepID=A0A510NXB1_TALPI|nr:hypothetical protein TCE0_018f05966 [Talaromyces pinophilus]
MESLERRDPLSILEDDGSSVIGDTGDINQEDLMVQERRQLGRLSERKRRRDSIGDRTEATHHGLEQIIERRFQMISETLFGAFERRIDQIAEQRFEQRFEQKFEQKFEQRFEQRFEQTFPQRIASVARQELEDSSTLLTAFHDGIKWSPEPSNSRTAISAREFFKYINNFTSSFVLTEEPRSSKPWLQRNIRVAIIDSGILSHEHCEDLQELDPLIYGAQKRIIGRRSWVGDESDCNDTCGHGTHVARQFLEVAPHADLIIAKVSSNMAVPLKHIHYVAEAIEWAVENHNADIISLSLGLDQDHEGIDAILDRVLNLNGRQGCRRRIIFAAASNRGSNRMRAYPARKRGVICIHASEGDGDTGSFNPDPEQESDNFSTLGIDIMSLHRGKPIYISGTSYATPIAAGIAANMLQFAKQNLEMQEEDKSLLYSYFGMRQVFKNISYPRGKYDYICPWRRKDRMASQTDIATATSLSDLIWSSIGVARQDARRAEAL